MSAYCFFDVREVTDREKMEEYKSRVFKTVADHGGRYVVLGGRVDAVEGEWKPVTPVLIEFPDMEAAYGWYNSEDYRELKELRLSATKGDAVFMEGPVAVA